MSLADARDIIIIAAGSIFILLLMVSFVIAVIFAFGTRNIYGSAQTLLKDEVIPMAHEGKVAAKRVQGTVTYMSENAVQPVMRVTAAVAGARRMLTVLAGLTGKRDNASSQGSR